MGADGGTGQSQQAFADSSPFAATPHHFAEVADPVCPTQLPPFGRDIAVTAEGVSDTLFEPKKKPLMSSAHTLVKIIAYGCIAGLLPTQTLRPVEGHPNSAPERHGRGQAVECVRQRGKLWIADTAIPLRRETSPIPISLGGTGCLSKNRPFSPFIRACTFMLLASACGVTTIHQMITASDKAGLAGKQEQHQCSHFLRCSQAPDRVQ